MMTFLLLLLVGHHAVSRPMLTAPMAPRGWPIVRHPKIAHLMPYVRGDSLGAVWIAARVLRRKFIDQNAQEDADHLVWVVHWAKLRKIGVRWLFTGKYDAKGREIRRRLTVHELNTSINDHPTEFVARLRFRERGGRRLRTAYDHMARCARYGITLCLEGKGTLKHPEAFEYIAESAIKTGVRIVFMRLQSIAGWREAFQHALAVDLKCALLPRMARPADWVTWRNRGVQRWGYWR